jgi:hypothetical protein
MKHDPADYAIDNEGDDYLTRVVVDVNSRTFYLYSSEGNTNVMSDNTVNEFIAMLSKVRDVCDEDMIFYSEPTFC